MLKNCLFGTFKLTRKTIKKKFVYNGWGIAFDKVGSWNFGNDFARNIVIFGVDNSSSSHTDNQKKKSLLESETSTADINDSE